MTIDLLSLLLIALGSFISNAIPFVGVPYLLGVGLAVSRMDPVSAALAIIASAAGATCGKIVVYLLGAGVRLKLGAKSKENLEKFVKLFRRSAFLAIVLFAATPLPDDLLYVPLGIAKYPLPLYVTAVFVGKIIVTTLATCYIGTAVSIVTSLDPTTPLGALVTAIVVGATVWLSYIVIKLDWGRVVDGFAQGFFVGIHELLRCFVDVNRKLVTSLRSLGPVRRQSS